MKIEISKQRETPLLSRKRVTFTIEYEGTTPSRLDVRKELAKKLGVDESLVVIKHIYGRYGIKKSKVIANVYTNLDELKKVEDNYMLVKHGLAEKKTKKAAEAAPAA